MADPGILLQKQLQKNFPKLGSIRKLINYQSTADDDYVPSTGTLTPTVVTTETIYAVFEPFSFTVVHSANRATDGITILSIDRKLIFPALDLTVTPKTNDFVIDTDTIKWRVIGVNPDPAGAHWELHLRPES